MENQQNNLPTDLINKLTYVKVDQKSPSTINLSSPDNEGTRRQHLILPISTIIKILCSLLFVIITYKLGPLILLVFLAMLLAVTLNPLVVSLQSKHISKRTSQAIVIISLLLLIGFCIALVIPLLFEQVANFIKNLPTLQDDIFSRLPYTSFLRQSKDRLLGSLDWSQAGKWFNDLISVGSIALGGISEMLILLVIAIYLLIDGDALFKWILAFFPVELRMKLRNTASEIAPVIFGYVAGQVITSVLVLIYSFIVLTVLKVPAALPLAIIAGLFDILPIIGFFLSTIPACLLALSVSSRTAMLVLGLYVFYHFLENYLIVPKVYGKRLRLSTLTVLLVLLAGGMLAGIPGAIAALPIIASYSVIESIWLKPFLGYGVTEKHEQQKDEEFGEKD